MSQSNVKNFAPAWAAGGTSEADVEGLEATDEIHAIGVQLAITGKSSGSSFSLAEGDPDIIVSGSAAGFGLTTVKFDMNGVAGCIQVDPRYLRAICVDHLGFDPYKSLSRSGPTYADTVPASGSSAATFYFNVLIPFINVQRWEPNALSPCGGQLNLNAHMKLLWAAGQTLGNITLANGTFAASAIQPLRMIVVKGAKPRPRQWIGPTKHIEIRALTKNPDVIRGQRFYELMFDTRDAATLAAAAGSFELLIDSASINASGSLFTDATSGYVNQTAPPDPRQSFDITRQNGAIVSGVNGYTPFIYTPGAISADDSEVPIVKSSTSLKYATASNGTLVLEYWDPMDDPKTQAAFAELRAGTEADGLTMDQCAVRFGAGGALADYKARWLASPDAPNLG